MFFIFLQAVFHSPIKSQANPSDSSTTIAHGSSEAHRPEMAYMLFCFVCGVISLEYISSEPVGRNTPSNNNTKEEQEKFLKKIKITSNTHGRACIKSSTVCHTIRKS